MSTATTEAVQARLVDAKWVGERMGCSARHVTDLRKAGRFGPALIRLGRLARYDREEVERWLDAGAPPREQWLAMQNGQAQRASA